MKVTTDDYLVSIGLGVGGGEADTQWPLLPSQVMPYFEMDQAVEIYDLLQKAQRKLTVRQAAGLFKYPGVIANFLRNAGIIGLKVANITGFKKYTKEEKENYLDYLLKLMSVLVKNDPLRRDGKNLLLTAVQAQKMADGSPWVLAEGELRQMANGFYATLFSWMWATHYDTFIGAGLEPHGPYNVTFKGERCKLLIRDFHSPNTAKIWPVSKKLPFKAAKIYQIYKDINIGITFENQVTSDEAMGMHLKAFSIEIDGKVVSDFKALERVEHQVEGLVSVQTAYVESISPLEQAKRGGLISYFSLRGIYEHFKISYDREEVIDNNINLFGDKFIKSLGSKKAYSQEYFKILDDPRNDLLGDEALKMING